MISPCIQEDPPRNSTNTSMESEEIDILLQEELVVDAEKKSILEDGTDSDCNCKRVRNLQSQMARTKKVFDKHERLRIKMRQKLIQAKNKIRRLEQEVRTNQSRISLHGICNGDQINVLNKTYLKVPRWSEETLVNSLKLKFACGSTGYKELLKQNFPLPALRTLTRRLEN